MYMGNTISIQSYEERIRVLEQRVLELEQKVFLNLETSLKPPPIVNFPRLIKPISQYKDITPVVINDFVDDNH